jgi:hypothetical protein
MLETFGLPRLGGGGCSLPKPVSNLKFPFFHGINRENLDFEGLRQEGGGKTPMLQLVAGQFPKNPNREFRRPNREVEFVKPEKPIALETRCLAWVR